MAIRFTVLLSILFIGTSFQEVKLKKTKVSDDITVMLPEHFFPMMPQDIAQRYPSVRKPLAAYTNDQMLVDFSINQSATMWRKSDIELAKSFMKASVMNMFDSVQFIQENIQEINGHKYIIFEMVSSLKGRESSFTQSADLIKYSYLQYLIINGKMIVFSLHSPIQLSEEWKPLAPKIMNSIKVSDNI